jgi:predicted choloylglycine hydrolase
MLKTFFARREDRPGEAWLSRFEAGREDAERWYRGQGLAEPPSGIECRHAVGTYMPELLPHYDQACGLVGEDDVAHRILSHYRPPPVDHGCSQAVWLGEGGPALVRNYDFPLSVVSGGFELTRWSERQVIAKAQRPWGGCLDGMNDDGLVASLTHGGGPELGLGFSIILMLRYVLETCRCVDEAADALSRIPVAQSQNVVLLDRTGAHATLYIGPNREPAVTRALTCTNHQEVAPPHSPSGLRQRVLVEALAEPALTLPALVRRFFEPPLYSRHLGSTTVYTAVYRPRERVVDYLWPGKCWSQSFERFEEATYSHDYGELIA